MYKWVLKAWPKFSSGIILHGLKKSASQMEIKWYSGKFLEDEIMVLLMVKTDLKDACGVLVTLFETVRSSISEGNILLV